MKPSIIRIIGFGLLILLLITLIISAIFFYFTTIMDGKIVSGFLFGIIIVISLCFLILESDKKPSPEYRISERKKGDKTRFYVEQKWYYYQLIIFPIDIWAELVECGGSRTLEEAKKSLEWYLKMKSPENNYTKYHKI